MNLNELLRKPNVTLAEIQQHLDSLSGDERVKQGAGVDAGLQKKLWQLAEKGDPLDYADIVPEGYPVLKPVPFEGINNMPIFRRFKKVFYRMNDGRIGGYNESSAAWFAGPGYYVVNKNEKGLFVDYYQVPKEKPAGWPEIVENKGLRGIVYGYMHDYLRRVYGKVLIGRAVKNGKEMGNYFMLARPEKAGEAVKA